MSSQESTSAGKSRHLLSSFSLFVIIFTVAALLLVGLLSLVWRMQTKSNLEMVKVRERAAIQLQHELIDNSLNSAFCDLFFLAAQNELRAAIEFDDPEHLAKMATEYLSLSGTKETYDQIRYLDEDGQEIVRVNFNKGKPTLVSADQLQNKGRRYYFTDAFKLAEGEVFVSPLDLNIEHGEVELPYKPMLRFATPICDLKGNKRGVVLLNYLGDVLLEQMKQAERLVMGHTMLLNRDGYWLLSPDSEQTWGFMFEDGKEMTFAHSYPAAAKDVFGQEAGQIRTDAGLFSFTTVYPLIEGVRSSTGAAEAFQSSDQSLASDEYFWKIVSFVPQDELAAFSDELAINLTIIGSAILVFVGIASWVFASGITRRRSFQAKLYDLAHFDPLTGLPNRSLFFDRLGQSHKYAKRYRQSFGIMYVDLDGFKQVNDTLGHDAGDELLIEVARRLRKVSRESDTVARLGGDEFMLILPEVDEHENAKIVATKVIAAIRQPYMLEAGEARISASVGLSLYPHDGEQLPDLIHLADQAMYACKNSGKDAFKLAMADMIETVSAVAPAVENDPPAETAELVGPVA